MDIEPFRTALEARVKLKEVPNDEFDEMNGQFSFADYVWKERGEQMYPSDVDPETMAEEDMYEPYEEVFGPVDDISLERVEDGDAYWAEVTVTLPPSPSQQRQLAHIVARGLQGRAVQ